MVFRTSANSRQRVGLAPLNQPPPRCPSFCCQKHPRRNAILTMDDTVKASLPVIPTREECDAEYTKARTSLDGRASPFIPGVGLRLSEEFKPIDLNGEFSLERWCVASVKVHAEKRKRHTSKYDRGKHDKHTCVCRFLSFRLFWTTVLTLWCSAQKHFGRCSWGHTRGRSTLDFFLSFSRLLQCIPHFFQSDKGPTIPFPHRFFLKANFVIYVRETFAFHSF